MRTHPLESSRACRNRAKTSDRLAASTVALLLFVIPLTRGLARAQADEVPIDFHVIGFDVDDATRKQLEEMAEAGGGKYHPAANASELSAALLDAGGLKPTPTPSPTPQGAMACGFALSKEVHAKWTQMGGEDGPLGCPTANEADAAPSPGGTAGRLATFSGRGGDAGAMIVLHKSGPLAGSAFEVHGCIAETHRGLGGTASWLGLPVSDVFVTQGGWRSDFEGGYVTEDKAVGQCRTWREGAAAGP